RIDQSIAMAALFTAHHLGCKAIAALTESGSTALWMSRHRVNVPIYALSRSESSVRRMALYRNVRPMLMRFSTSESDRDSLLNQAEAKLIEKKAVASGDSYAITCGEPIGTAGGTNMLKVMRVPR
ncbi:MAG: pyruvate kinase alpha/beta domain-containing protein, partial [Thiomonas sp.]